MSDMVNTYFRIWKGTVSLSMFSRHGVRDFICAHARQKIHQTKYDYMTINDN